MPYFAMGGHAGAVDPPFANCGLDGVSGKPGGVCPIASALRGLTAPPETSPPFWYPLRFAMLAAPFDRP
jgi:hypothetical protein